MEQLAKEYKDYKVEWNDKDNGLSLPYTTMYSLFQPVLSRINEVIKKVLQKSECNEIDEIILVGGFATSPLLSQEISSLFPNMTVKQNKDALTAVLKGAVKYGIHHKLIKSRKIPLSIGIELCVLFVQGIHDEHLKISINGKDYCKGVFLQCIKINESIKQDVVFERNFQPIDNASYCRFTVYGSQSDSVKYVTNRECYPIAHFEIGDLSPLQENRMIRITLRLGGTEMKVSACSAIHDDIKLFVKSVDAVHGTTLGLAETVNIDVRSL